MMERFRLGLLVSCAVFVIYSGASLLAAPMLDWVCCNVPEDCLSVGGKCCDNVALGMDPCSPDAPGMCMPTCIPGGLPR
jgi:hypothetical protein